MPSRNSRQPLGVSREMQSTDPIDIPLYGIAFDHAEFAKCSDFDQRAFLYYMKRLDAYGYLARHGKPQKEWAFLNLEEYIHTPVTSRRAGRCRRVRRCGKRARPSVMVFSPSFSTKGRF